jgi:parallel beta-helix repeat protein
MRADGTAANKAAATGPCTTVANCMSVTTHNAQTFSATDVIVFCDDGGTYTSEVVAPSSGSSGDGNRITYQGESGGSPVFTITESGKTCFKASSKNYLTIQDFSCSASATTSTYGAIYFLSSDNITIDNVTVTGSDYAGIRAGSCSYVTIQNCTVSNVLGLGSGIRVFGAAGGDSNITVSGNTVSNIGTEAITCASAGAHGINIVKNSVVKVYNNYVSNCVGSGIQVSADAGYSIDDVEVYNNTIRDVATRCRDQGIHINGSADDDPVDLPMETVTNAKIYNNDIRGVSQAQVVENSDGYCISIDSSTQGAEVYGNFCYDCDGGGIVTPFYNTTGNSIHHNVIIACGVNGTNGRGGLSAGTGSTGNVFYNNTVYGCYYGMKNVNKGADAGETPTTATFKNNIVMNSVSYHVYDDADSGDPTLNYNMYYPDGASKFLWETAPSDDFADWKADASQDANSQAVDPLFANATGYDFRLKPGSPAINAGDTSVTFTTSKDYLRQTIPCRGATLPDIGAVEACYHLWLVGE